MSGDLQARISRNVRVLMPLRGIGDQKTLAERLGWGADRVSTSLRGQRRWAVSDLDELADVFGVSPGDLLGDVGALVNLAAPAMTGTDSGVTRRVTSQYVPGNGAKVIPFPQVGKLRSGYRWIGPRGRRPVSRFRARSTSGRPFAGAAV